MIISHIQVNIIIIADEIMKICVSTDLTCNQFIHIMSVVLLTYYPQEFMFFLDLSFYLMEKTNTFHFLVVIIVKQPY
jgi:hypothetical protein